MEPFEEPFDFPKHLPLRSTISYGGHDFQITASLQYQLSNRSFIMYRLTGSTGRRYFEPAFDIPGERGLWLSEISLLDIDAPFPRTIDWQGRSYLQSWGGLTALRGEEADEDVSLPAGPTWVWRYRASGDEYLQIEQNEAKIRMFAGPSVHWSMIEARPET